MDIEVRTIKKSSPIWNSMVRIIESFCYKETVGTKDVRNYTVGLHTDEWLALTYYERDCEVLGFSSVIARDMWNNSARIVNRMLKSRRYRFETSPGMMTDHTIEMLKQQIDFCRKEGFDTAFMSRESNSKNHAMKRYIRNMGFTEWVIPEGRYKTSNYDSPECWQHVMYTPLKDESQFQLEKITEEKYHEKYKT